MTCPWQVGYTHHTCFIPAPAFQDAEFLLSLPCIYHHLSMWPIFAPPIFAKSVLHLSEFSEFSWWLFGAFWQTLHPNRTLTYSTQQLGPPPREKLARELRKHRMRWNTDLNSLEKHREGWTSAPKLSRKPPSVRGLLRENDGSLAVK